jgi:hypothetical protein
MPSATGEVQDLLQHLIRNACVNDGRADSGAEHRSVDTRRCALHRLLVSGPRLQCAGLPVVSLACRVPDGGHALPSKRGTF